MEDANAKPNEPMRTITLWSEDLGSGSEPIIVLCPGHVTAEQFTEAHRAEGWDCDDYHQDELSYEWWLAEPTGTEGALHYRRSSPDQARALRFTVNNPNG